MSATGMVKDPTTSTPPRAPGSVRRSSHIDILWLPAEGVEAGPGTMLVIRAGARDVVTGEPGPPAVVAEAGLVAWIGRRSEVLHLETTPAVDASGLVGRSATSGFRRAARELTGVPTAEPLGLLFDDLPVAVLISGYAMLRSGKLGGPISSGPDPAGHMRDLCSGWRSDGIMIRSLEAGRGVPVPDVVVAPDLAVAGDPLAIEDLPPLPDGCLRRRRRIDVLAGDPVQVEATFRDTYCGEGVEGVLHEYVVAAEVDDAGRITAIEANPRVLPWGECPAAAAHVDRLLGADVAGLASGVPATISGIASCTHLNDLLRSLNCLPRLIALRP
jgi:hypothetical protein